LYYLSDTIDLMKIIFIVLFFSLNLFAQSIDFYKEDITFKLTPTKVYVSGLYYFKNKTDKIQKNLIYFPVIPTCIINVADSIDIFNLSKLHSVEISKKTSNGFFFILETGANDSTIYQIQYQQDICGDSALYVLESTQKWGKALSSGIYKIIVPDSLKIAYFSYKPDSTYHFTNFNIYYLEKKDFIPDRDIVLKFKNF
jgi:hypothetical protein